MKLSKNIDLKKLSNFLRKNRAVDFRRANLQHKQAIEKYNWGVSGKEKANLISLLKAYQRILRVLPNDSDQVDTVAIAKALLKNGIHSALQIADMPKRIFIKDYLKCFAGDADLAERTYKRAVVSRKQVTLKYTNRLQQLELHARAAGLNR